jgi:hypothetical protein
MRTIKQVRQNFWATFPQFKSDYRVKKRQNDYCIDIRCTFVDYVDSLQRYGIISDKLADKVTL